MQEWPQLLTLVIYYAIITHVRPWGSYSERGIMSDTATGNTVEFVAIAEQAQSTSEYLETDPSDEVAAIAQSTLCAQAAGNDSVTLLVDKKHSLWSTDLERKLRFAVRGHKALDGTTCELIVQYV